MTGVTLDVVVAYTCVTKLSDVPVAHAVRDKLFQPPSFDTSRFTDPVETSSDGDGPPRGRRDDAVALQQHDGEGLPVSVDVVLGTEGGDGVEGFERAHLRVFGGDEIHPCTFRTHLRAWELHPSDRL